MFQKGTHFGRDHRPFDLLPWTRVAATRDFPTNRLFPGRRCCSDVAYLSQAFSQHTGPGAIMDKSGRHFVGLMSGQKASQSILGSPSNENYLGSSQPQFRPPTCVKKAPEIGPGGFLYGERRHSTSCSLVCRSNRRPKVVDRPPPGLPIDRIKRMRRSLVPGPCAESIGEVTSSSSSFHGSGDLGFMVLAGASFFEALCRFLDGNCKTHQSLV
jgi:hypothetical protein